MQREDATQIKKGTQKTYDVVAGEFSATRSKFWEELAFLAERMNAGDQVLDIGCGNGRFFPLVKTRGAHYVGTDYSQGLINEAKRLHPEGKFIIGDAVALPFPDEIFDIAYSFAVLHHIPGNEQREQFVREAMRVIKPGGLLILTVWHLWKPEHFLQLMMHANPFSSFEHGDIMLTFGKGKAPRYLHAFTKKALSRLLSRNGFAVLKIETAPRPSGEKNIVAVARRTQ